MKPRTVSAIFAFFAAVFAVCGTLDYADALEREALEKITRPERASDGGLKLYHPIPWDAIVIQADENGIQKARYYVRSTRKETTE